MFNITRAALACALLCTSAAPSLAGDHAFTLHNNLTKPISKFIVRGGEVSGFGKIGAGERLTFTVSLPDAICTAVIGAFVSGSRREGRVNICDAGGYVLTSAEGGTKFLPLSQVMLLN
jgi:hypothetical protein